MTLSLLLLLIAVILFAINAIASVPSARINMTSLGLAFFAASFLVGDL